MWDFIWQTTQRNLTDLLWDESLQTALVGLQALESEAEIQRWGEVNLPRLSPAQLERVIARLPAAPQRTAAIAVLWPIAQSYGSTAHATTLRSLYASSGWPLVATDSGVDQDASVAMISAWIAIAIIQAAGVSQERLKADRKLWEAPETSTDASGTTDYDPLLTLAAWGIQGAQVGEFVAKQTRQILNSAIIELLLPLPFQLVAKGVQVLTSDVILEAGQVIEGNLETFSRSRQLLLQALPTHIPSFAHCQAATPPVAAAIADQLQPMLAQHLLALARVSDPPLRNRWLDDMGRQFNALNPLQYLQGWFQQHWLEDWQTALSTTQYPQIECLQVYQDGIAQAAQMPNLMAQADCLRQAALRLDSEAIDNNDED